MNKTTIEQAQEIIYGDREKTYGNPSENLDKIAKIWETIFGIPVTKEQVCWAMVGLKMARASNPNAERHKDNEIDAIGYLALIDRINVCPSVTVKPENFIEQENRFKIPDSVVPIEAEWPSLGEFMSFTFNSNSISRVQNPTTKHKLVSFFEEQNEYYQPIFPEIFISDKNWIDIKKHLEDFYDIIFSFGDFNGIIFPFVEHGNLSESICTKYDLIYIKLVGYIHKSVLDVIEDKIHEMLIPIETNVTGISDKLVYAIHLKGYLTHYFTLKSNNYNFHRLFTYAFERANKLYASFVVAKLYDKAKNSVTEVLFYSYNRGGNNTKTLKFEDGSAGKYHVDKVLVKSITKHCFLSISIDNFDRILTWVKDSE
jgi:hypothetical protein